MAKKKDLVLKTMKAITTSRTTLQRPILACVQFDTNGYMTVTDSHVLMRVATDVKPKEELLLDMREFALRDDGQYPDTSHLIQTTSTNASFELDADLLDKLHGFLRGLRVSDEVTLTWSREGKLMVAAGEAVMTTDTSGEFDPAVDEAVISFGVRTLRIAIDYLADAIKGDAANEGDIAVFKFYGTLRPAQIETRRTLFLVTPLRVF